MADIIISEASGQNNPWFGKWQAPIASYLRKEAEAMEQQSIARKLFRMRKSTHWAESYGSAVGMGNFKPVPENGDYPVTGMRHGRMKTIPNTTWKNMFAISWEMIMDSDLIKLQSQPQEFMTAWQRTQEEFFAEMLARAMNGETEMLIDGMAFDITGADDLAVFSPNHKSLVTEEEQPNAFSDEFSLDALSKMSTAMQNTKGERGELLAMWPDTIVIPNDEALKTEIISVIGSEKKPGGSNNDINPQYGNWNLVIWPYLNKFLTKGSKPWMLMDSKYVETHDCMIWQQRHPLEVTSEIQGNDANVWKGKARFGGGFANWRGMMAGGLEHGIELADLD